MPSRALHCRGDFASLRTPCLTLDHLARGRRRQTDSSQINKLGGRDPKSKRKKSTHAIRRRKFRTRKFRRKQVVTRGGNGVVSCTDEVRFGTVAPNPNALLRCYSPPQLPLGTKIVTKRVAQRRRRKDRQTLYWSGNHKPRGAKRSCRRRLFSSRDVTGRT